MIPYSSLIKSYQDGVNIHRKKALKIGMPILLILLILMVVSFMLYNQYILFMILTYIVPILIFSCILIVLLVGLYGLEKPFYTLLVSGLIKHLALTENRWLNYTAFDKEKALFIAGGLYPRGASKTTRFKIDWVGENALVNCLCFTEIFTQTDKSRVVYFKGLYIVISSSNKDYFQIRTKGKERHRHVKLNRTKRPDKTVIFTNERPVPKTALSLYNDLSSQYSKVAVSGIPGAIHVSIEPFFAFKQKPTLTPEQIDSVHKELVKAIAIADHISATFSD